MRLKILMWATTQSQLGTSNLFLAEICGLRFDKVHDNQPKPKKYLRRDPTLYQEYESDSKLWLNKNIIIKRKELFRL